MPRSEGFLEVHLVYSTLLPVYMLIIYYQINHQPKHSINGKLDMTSNMHFRICAKMNALPSPTSAKHLYHHKLAN